MNSFVTKLSGLILVAGTCIAAAQVPPPPPAEGPATPRTTNPPAANTNTGFFSRPTNFNRFMRNTNAPAVPAAPGAVAVPVTPDTGAQTSASAAARAAAQQGAAPIVTPGTPAAPGVVPPPPTGNVLAPPGTVPGAAPIISGANTNFAATNIVPRGSTNDIPAKMIQFQEADLSQIFELYAELTGRTIIRSPQVPANVKITLRNQTPLTRQEGIDALNTVLGLNQIAMIPEGEKFIKAVPQAAVPQEATPFTTGPVEELRESQVPVAQIVTLKNLQPEEATSILQPFAKLPNSIVGVKGSPVLVLRDYSENVKRMLEILERVDVAMPLDIETVVIPIKYALAGDVASVLNGLGANVSGSFGAGSGASAAGFGAPVGSGIGTGIGTGIGAGAGIGVGGSRFGGGVGGGTYPGGSSFGARSFGTTGGVGTSGAAGFSSRGGAFGSRLSSAVNRAVGAAGGAGAGDFVLFEQAKIIPDERSNALLVFADRRDIAQIREIISKLDIVLPQVLIEALILEVNLNEGQNLGVSMRQNNQRLGDLNVAGGSVNGPGFLDPRNITGMGSLGTNALPGGFSYFGKLNEDLDFAITAAANDSRLNVLSRPRVTTSTAKPASIFVGETRPYITGTYFSDFAGSGSRSQYAQTQIGISLNVLPIINQEGLVVMDIQQQISQVGDSVNIDGNQVPITIDRNANAYVAVHDRDTIILGGFISTTKNKRKEGVPYLKDIPGLGLLFRSTSENISRVELMVLIRPTVLPTPEAAALHTAAERDAHPNVKRAEREEQEYYQKQLEKERKAAEKAERRLR